MFQPTTFLCLWFQNEARKLNHQEVVEEDKRLKLPANWEAKKARLEWELQEEEKKKVRNCSAVFISGLFYCIDTVKKKKAVYQLQHFWQVI